MKVFIVLSGIFIEGVYLSKKNAIKYFKKEKKKIVKEHSFLNWVEDEMSLTLLDNRMIGSTVLSIKEWNVRK